MIGIELQIGERKHKKQTRRLQENDIMGTCRNNNFETYYSKGESRHKKYEIWVLQLAFFMKIRIGGNETQFFVDHDPSVTGF